MERVKCTLPRWIYKISQSVQTAWLSACTWAHVNLTVMCSRWLTLNMRSQPELVQTVRLCGHRLFDSEISLRTSTKSWPKSVAEWSAKCSGFISSSSAGREERFSRGFCRTFALFFSSPLTVTHLPQTAYAYRLCVSHMKYSFIILRQNHRRCELQFSSPHLAADCLQEVQIKAVVSWSRLHPFKREDFIQQEPNSQQPIRSQWVTVCEYQSLSHQGLQNRSYTCTVRLTDQWETMKSVHVQTRAGQ